MPFYLTIAIGPPKVMMYIACQAIKHVREATTYCLLFVVIKRERTNQTALVIRTENIIEIGMLQFKQIKNRFEI